ncbi:MAG: Hsp70 family protein [Anaerolineae bacterium]|nr:Hsp70 family protein [Anaerolineae bacterium]
MIVGMDFGTTNSGMSFYDGQRLNLIPLDPTGANPHVARTALYITNRRRVYMGREAVEKYYEQNINRKVKYERVWVGEITLEFAELPTWVRDVSVEKDVLSPGRLFLSFKTGLRSPTYLGTVVGSQFYLLEDIVALYLYVTRLRAEAYLGTDLRRIVLGRPVRFSTNPEQDKLAEQRLVHAAFLAGYEEVYLQAEPIAAAYFYETTIDRPENVLIFDFGGGTLDITIARLGDQHRQILATGGVPVAGDIFDQKLVRNYLPRHFGEDSTYRGDTGTRLPVPANFFEAFADWQEMLELNRPDFLRMLDHITRTAEKREHIRRLYSLITSSYSLKMFDAVEAAKRDLSSQVISTINLDGPGFSVRQPLTRRDFEVLIDEETNTIAAVLDDVLARAGLRYGQIDTVIRTGGSAQIPAFINVLNQRFGRDKVRAIDTFSSVTSGLGILGYHQETGTAGLIGYHRDAWTYGATLRQDGKPGAPKVDLDLMKKFIDFEERHEKNQEDRVCIVAITDETEVRAVTQPQRAFFDADTLSLADLKLDEQPDCLIAAGNPDDRVLLMTTDYRFPLRRLADLAELAVVNLNLAEMESFYTDQFGRETVCALTRWDDLQRAERIMLVSGRGEAKVMYGDALRDNLDQPHPYHMERLTGAPAALVPLDRHEIIALTNAGSVARIQPESLAAGTQRLLRLRKDEQIVSVLCLDAPTDLLLAASTGRGKRIHTRSIPFTLSSDLGTKVLARRDFCAAVTRQPGTLWAITTRRMMSLEFDAIPLDPPTPSNSRALLRLDDGESLLSLHYLS